MSSILREVYLLTTHTDAKPLKILGRGQLASDLDNWKNDFSIEVTSGFRDGIVFGPVSTAINFMHTVVR